MTTAEPLEPYDLCGVGEYRLAEAIVNRLIEEPRLVALTNEGDSGLHENTAFHIAVGYFNSRERTPFLAVFIVDTEPQTADNPSTGWQRSVVRISAHSRDDIRSTLLLDWLVRMLTNWPDNRQYLDFTNQHVRIAGTRYLGRTGVMLSKTRENEGKDTYSGTIEIEVIWLDVPCDGECQDTDQEVCEDLPDCSEPCE